MTRQYQRIMIRSVKGINLLFILIASLSLTTTLAQSTRALPMADTLELPPGTVRVIVLIKKIQQHQATVEVIEVIAEGHGIINILSRGQVLNIAIPEKGKMSKGKKMEAFLKEKVGVDASQSYYTLLRHKDM